MNLHFSLNNLFIYLLQGSGQKGSDHSDASLILGVVFVCFWD